MRWCTASRLLKENVREQAEKNAQTFSIRRSLFCFRHIDISRDLVRTGFEHAHLKSNRRSRVLVTIIGSLINVLSYFKICFVHTKCEFYTRNETLLCLRQPHPLRLEQIKRKLSKRVRFIFVSLFPFCPFCALRISELIEVHLLNPWKGKSK